MLTDKKNLRTGNSVWLSYPSAKVPVETLASDKVTDVVVIGAGITGAMVSQELTGAGFSVIILDRRGPLKGATSATTALVQSEIDEPLSHLQRKIGQENAGRAWRRSKLGIESLAAKIQALDIKCHLERRHSLYLAGNVLNANELRIEQQARNTIGLHAEFLGKKQLLETHGIKRNAALKVFDNLAVDPRQMAAGFLRASLKQGARIFAPAIAENIEHGRNKVFVRTADGPVITAKYLVFATGYEIPKYIKTRRHKIHSTWAIATRRQPGKLWPESCFVWEASDPYLYLRTTFDGRVICGGEDEDFSDEEKRDALIAKKTAALERKLGALFPEIDSRAEFAWTGSFGGSTTGLPSIGAIPGMKNCFSIMAFGGNGITYARIAAEIIRSLLTGKNDPEADLFAFR